jgi:hypothetical protein
VNKVNYCNGDTIQLINKSFNASSYVWKINNSLYSSSTNTSIVTNTTIANYTITLLSYGVCTDSTSLVIHKLNNSVASFTKSNKNLYAIFNNTSLYEASYKWYFGDGSTSVAYSPSHVYDTLKSYNVCLKVSNACNRDSICQLLVAEDHLQTSFYSFYQGSNDHDEMGYGIAQSRNGDIMVTGLANAYSASGDKGFKMVIDKTNGDSKYQAIDSYNGATVYHNVISTHDNGFIYTAEINLDNDIITKKDSIDNRLWTYKMPLKKISSIIEAKDSSIYVCGYNLSNCCIVKLNSIGKILWYKVFSGGKNGMSIIETSDRNILVTGQYVANVSAYLLKINPNGQVIWSKYYSAAQTFNSLSVSETNDHHYLLTGRVFLTSPYADSWAAKLDTSGTPVWSKSYHAAYVSLSQGNGFYENQYGQYFLSLSATSSYSNLLLRLDNSGNVKWFRSYALSPTYPSSFLYKSILTHDGGIALCGNTTYNPNPNKDIYVFKIDTAGYNGGCLIDQMTYTVSNFPMTANTNLFESVASTSYGQIPINNSFWGTNLYAFTDSTQCNSSNIITGINSMESYSSYSSVNINPNPANKNIRISSESYINDIVIFDALGKKVYQISNLNDLYINIDLSNYHTGLYYIKISGGDFSNVRKIIKSE